MSEEKENLNQENIEEVTLPLKNEDVVDLNVNTNQKIDVLADGTEILRDSYDDEEEVEEEISDENLRKLVQFTTGRKNISDIELEELRTNDTELERLIRISMVKSRQFTYAPKKVFNSDYRKKRQHKNNQASKSRAINRK